MSKPHRIVVVDSYGPLKALPDQFIKSGAELIRVQSTSEVPLAYQGDFDLNEYVANIVFDGDLDHVVKKLSTYNPTAVVAVGETGVELADDIAAKLGTATANGVEHSRARRNKYLMIETIRNAGVAAARQILPKDEEELAEWHREIGGMIVVKPLSGGGGGGICFCDDPEQSIAAFQKEVGAMNLLSQRNTGVVAQEYLRGTEYMVNTVSRDGVHHVTDIWRTTRITANGVLDLCSGAQLIRRRGDLQDEMASYSFQVLDALGIRHGPAHIEVKMTVSGPVLVEVGARICGGKLPHYAQVVLGESQLDWTVDAYIDPEKFHARAAAEYPAGRAFAVVPLISPADGILRNYRNLHLLEQLESFYDVRLFVKPGDRIARTVDDISTPALFTLMHDCEEVVLRDAGTIHYHDGLGFYDVELSEQGATNECAVPTG